MTNRVFLLYIILNFPAITFDGVQAVMPWETETGAYRLIEILKKKKLIQSKNVPHSHKHYFYITAKGRALLCSELSGSSDAAKNFYYNFQSFEKKEPDRVLRQIEETKIAILFFGFYIYQADANPECAETLTPTSIANICNYSLRFYGYFNLPADAPYIPGRQKTDDCFNQVRKVDFAVRRRFNGLYLPIKAVKTNNNAKINFCIGIQFFLGKHNDEDVVFYRLVFYVKNRNKSKVYCKEIEAIEEIISAWNNEYEFTFCTKCFGVILIYDEDKFSELKHLIYHYLTDKCTNDIYLVGDNSGQRRMIKKPYRILAARNFNCFSEDAYICRSDYNWKFDLYEGTWQNEFCDVKTILNKKGYIDNGNKTELNITQEQIMEIFKSKESEEQEFC